MLGDLIVDVVPAVAQDVWIRWSKETTEAERNEQVRQIAQARLVDLRSAAEAVVEEVAGDRSEQERQELVSYLTHVQHAVQRSLRRPSDPSGTSLPAGFSIRSERDVMRLLPDRPPRFRPGDRPIPGVDWQLVELLGVGGFGEVWQACNPHVPNAAPVALKFCLDASAARSLRHEAALINRLKGFDPPGVVRLLHTYLSHDPPCLEYEYVEGGDLAGVLTQWRDSNGGLKPERAARLILQLANILTVVHRQEPPIVHRDLKPANILVQVAADGELRFQIADFGIGGLAASGRIRQTGRGISIGACSMASLRGSHTPLYAPPEQMKGSDPDPRDDVHALGVIWYQLLTGELDSGAPTGLDWFDDLRKLGMDDAQVRLLASCFSKAAKRPADAGVLADEIQRLFFHDASDVTPVQIPHTGQTATARPAVVKPVIAKVPPEEHPNRFTNTIGMEFVLIPSGEYERGARNHSAVAIA